MVAAINGHASVVRLLLERGASTVAEDKVCGAACRAGVWRWGGWRGTPSPRSADGVSGRAVPATHW